jgi:hypothetical protein
MPSAFKNADGHAAASLTTVYTCPALTTALVIGGSMSNIHATDVVEFSMNIVDTSAGATIQIHDTLNIPITNSFALDTKYTLEAGDTIEIGANATSRIDYTLAILELT